MTGRTGPSVNHQDILPTMLDYVVKYFYPEVSFLYSNMHVDLRCYCCNNLR